MSSRLQRLASANLVLERKAKLLSLLAIRNIIQTYSLGKRVFFLLLEASFVFLTLLLVKDA